MSNLGPRIGASSYYQPTNLGLRTSGGALLEPELDASVPAILFAEFLASLFFVFLGGSAVSITGHVDGENRTFLRILTIAIVGQETEEEGRVYAE